MRPRARVQQQGGDIGGGRRRYYYGSPPRRPAGGWGLDHPVHPYPPPPSPACRWRRLVRADLVRYKQYQYYVAADAETLVNENLTITTLNLAMLSALSNPIVANFVAGDESMAAWRDPKALFVQRRVRDVIWCVKP